MKKFLKISLLVVLSLAVLVSISCGKDNEKVENINDSTITLAETNVNMILGEEKYIQANYTIEIGKTLEFVSSNSDVVAVDNEGKLSAQKVGESTITVKYGEATATCKVNVTMGAYLPVLNVNEVQNDSISLLLGEDIELYPYVLFNGKEFNDATFAYSINGDAIEIEGNTIKTKKVGTCQLSIVANWRSLENVSSLTKVISVSVKNCTEFVINDGAGAVLELYTMAKIGEEEFSTNAPFEVKTFYNGQPVEAQISVVEGEDVIAYENGVVKSKGKVGYGIVQISYTGADQVFYYKDVRIDVNYSIAKYDQVIEFSIMDGNLPLGDLFGEGKNLVKVVLGDKELPLENNLIKGGITVSGKEKPQEIELTVYTDSYAYDVRIVPYTKILTKAEDLAIFNFNGSEVAVFDGYYILGNDIDASGYMHKTPYRLHPDENYWKSYTTQGLTGTFDGNGHVISNLSFGNPDEAWDDRNKLEYGYCGLFGLVCNGTIKNVAFTNVKYVNKNVANGALSLFGTYMYKAKVENVLASFGRFDFNTWKYAYSTLAYEIRESTVNNCIIYLEQDVLPAETNIKYGSLMARHPSEAVNDTNSFTNTYVISKLPLAVNGRTVVLGANETADVFNTGEVAGDGKTYWKYSGVERYDGEQEFVNANKNLNAFNNSVFWTIIGGVPRFISAVSQEVKVYVNDVKVEDEIRLIPNQANNSVSLKLGDYVYTSAITLSVIEGEDVVSINGDKFTALALGTAKIRVTTQNFAKEFKVVVKHNLNDYNSAQTRFAFSALDGELPSDMLKAGETVLEAYDKNGLKLTVSNNKVLGVESNSSGFVDNQLDIYTDMGGYRVYVKVATKVIDEASDLAVFSMGYYVDDNHDYSTSVKETGDKTTVFDGYYVLVKDIDATGYSHLTPYLFTNGTNELSSPTAYFQQNGVITCGLTGTFDGNGHTISNLTFGGGYTLSNSTKYELKYGNGGLFGAIGYKGTVKNVAFTNVTFAMNGSSTASNTYVLATFIAEANIENVYIQLNGLARNGYRNGTATIAHQIMKSKLNNVVIEVSNDGLTEAVNSSNFGSLVARNNANMAGTSLEEYGTWTNVIVISTIGLGRNGSMCGENETGTTKLVGARRYDNVEAFNNDTAKDLTSFEESEFWTVTSSGLPKFN